MGTTSNREVTEFICLNASGRYSKVLSPLIGFGKVLERECLSQRKTSLRIRGRKLHGRSVDS